MNSHGRRDQRRMVTLIHRETTFFTGTCKTSVPPRICGKKHIIAEKKTE